MLMYYHGGHMTDSTSVYIFSKSIDQRELEHTIITYQEENQEALSTVLNWNCSGWQTLDSKLFLIGENGETLFFDKGIKGKEGKIDSSCIFTGSVAITNGYVVAYGMDDCLKITEDGKKWKNYNQGIDKDNYGILDYHFNPNHQCYCVCWDGDIYWKNSGSWEDIYSPVNSNLTSCLVLDDGSFIACGNDGIIITGKGNQSNVLSHQFQELDFWDVFEFERQVYIVSTTTIFTFKNDKLSPILGWDLSDSGVYSSRMKTANGFWVFTEKTIYNFSDGEFSELSG